MAMAVLMAAATAGAYAAAVPLGRAAQAWDMDIVNSTGELQSRGGRVLLPVQSAPPRSLQCSTSGLPWYGENTGLCFGYSCTAANGAVTVLSSGGCPCMTDNECWNAWHATGGNLAALQPVCSGASYGVQGRCIIGPPQPYVNAAVSQPISTGCSSQYPCSASALSDTCDISYCGTAPTTCSANINGCRCATSSQCSNAWAGSLNTPYCNAAGYCSTPMPSPVPIIPGAAAAALSGGAIAGIIAGVVVVIILPISLAIACCGGIAAACSACHRANSTPVTVIDGPPVATVITMNPISPGGGAGSYASTSGSFKGVAAAYPNPYGQMPMQQQMQQQAGPVQQQMPQLQGMQQAPYAGKPVAPRPQTQSVGFPWGGGSNGHPVNPYPPPPQALPPNVV